MRRIAIAIAAAFAIAAVPATLEAAPCKDAKGKFVKCPPAAAAKPAAAKPAAAKPAAAKPAAAKPAAKPATTKKAPCRDAKGKFTKCK